MPPMQQRTPGSHLAAGFMRILPQPAALGMKIRARKYLCPPPLFVYHANWLTVEAWVQLAIAPAAVLIECALRGCDPPPLPSRTATPPPGCPPSALFLQPAPVSNAE